jgi:hypothetical protein
MFIRNDAPNTPENLRWRLLEKWVCIIGAAIVVGRATLDVFSVSQEFMPQTYGLSASPYPTEYKLDTNDG